MSMNLTKKITTWLVALVMTLGLISQTVFAQEPADSALQYEVIQEINEDKTESTISIKIAETETIHLEKVTLPDGTDQTENLSEITYVTSQNGQLEFKVTYVMETTPYEETIPVKVSEIIGKTNLIPDGIKYIHLNSANGDDINDGLTVDTSVKTFEKAKSLMQDGDIILIDSFYDVLQNETWDLTEFPNSKVQRNCSAHMIEIADQVSLTLSNIRIDGSHAQGIFDTGFDSIIRMGEPLGTEANASSLILNSGAILENNINSGGYGGAINANSFNQITMNDGAVIQNNGTIEDEKGPIYGGAIELENGSNFTMNGGVISNNHAVTGGAVSIIAATMTMNGGSILNNSANNKETFEGHYGGAICLRNFAGISGAPAYDIQGEVSFTMTGGTISGNEATYKSANGDNGKGGAIATFADYTKGCEFEPKITIDIQGGNIIGNTAVYGGGISAYFKATDVSISNANISGNIALAQGGAIYNVFNANVDLTNSVIAQNKAPIGAGVYLYASTFNMHSGSINQNEASRYGGGVFIDYHAWRDETAVCTILGGSIHGNKAQLGKGSDGIYQNSTLNIGDHALIDKDNDVYLPSGRVIDVITPLTSISRDNSVSITSEDCVVEDEQIAGTKLVHYRTDAGGIDAAQNAEEQQLYIPSTYMQDGLVIGKSLAQNQLDHMTYVQKETYPVIYEFISGTTNKTLPQEVIDYLPIDTNRYLEGTMINAIQPVQTEVEVTNGTWKFQQYDAISKLASQDNLNADCFVQFTGTWTFEKSGNPGPENPDPDKPTDPDRPVDPDKPIDPDKPTDPNKPGNPDKPADPDKPDSPNKPTDSNKPGQSGSNTPGHSNTNKPNKGDSVGTATRTNLLFSSVLFLISGICMLGVVALKIHKFNDDIR